MEGYFDYVGINEMRRYFALWATLSLITWFLVGCELMFQAGPGLTIGRDEYLKSIKPFIAYWEKNGMTEESRLEDWIACEGNENGTFSWKVERQLPNETDEATRTRQEYTFQRCMISSGYHYTGDCSSKYMQARPLCGAP
tara:strand:- start:3564 stop:3983 length:420 start_codon:yes stop_codon:yes gene_type:complete